MCCCRPAIEGLYHAITDCGAGGFSSAVGEMGEEIGASVRSRQGAAQIRRPVVHGNLDFGGAGTHGAGGAAGAMAALASAVRQRGRGGDGARPFRGNRPVAAAYQGQQVADLDMHFLHDGRPPVVRQANATRAASVSDRQDLA